MGICYRTPPFHHYSSDTAINTQTTDETENSNNYLKTAKRSKRVFGDITSSPTHVADIEQLKSLFADFTAVQNNKLESLASALGTIIEQNKDIQKSVELIKTKYDEVAERTSFLENENKECKSRILSLENKLEVFEKQSRCSTIEIRNIPKQTQENKQITTKIVTDIGSALKLDPPIRSSDMKDIYRAKNDNIVVVFSCSSQKEAVIASFKNASKFRRENKEQPFSTAHINLPGPPRTIFISESLTSKARLLFYTAREHVKNKKLVAAWTSYGKILVKKEEGMLPARVDSEEELLRIISQ